MKRFTLGFITGSIIAAAVTGFAVEYIINPNPFPVKVNGSETAIEGYNINDSSYFKLRDIADAVGGFSVDFKDNAIVLESNASYIAPSEKPSPDTSELNEDGTRKYTVDGLLIQYRDNIGYVRISDIEKLYNLFLISDNCIYDSNKNKHEIVIPTHPEHISLIPIEFYESTLMSFISTIVG